MAPIGPKQFPPAQRSLLPFDWHGGTAVAIGTLMVVVPVGLLVYLTWWAGRPKNAGGGSRTNNALRNDRALKSIGFRPASVKPGKSGKQASQKKATPDAGAAATAVEADAGATNSSKITSAAFNRSITKPLLDADLPEFDFIGQA